MKRYYFIEDNLDDLETIERELEARNVVTPQIHVLSQDDAALRGRHLNEVHSFMKKDVVRSGEIGAIIGLIVAVIAIATAAMTRVLETIGWVPFIFLAIILLGFFTWEGGLFGIQTPNSHFRRFEEALRAGKHVFIVDVEDQQEGALKQVLAAHPGLKPAGTGASAPRWLVYCQQKWREFLNWAP